MTRPELCARITALRQVLDLLWDVTAMTGRTPFTTIGTAKVELCGLLNQLWTMDRAEMFAAQVSPSKSETEEQWQR